MKEEHCNKRVKGVILSAIVIVMAIVKIGLFHDNNKVSLMIKFEVARERAELLHYQVETLEGREKYIKNEKDFKKKVQELREVTIKVSQYAKKLGIDIDPTIRINRKEILLKKLIESQYVDQELQQRITDRKQRELLQRRARKAKELEKQLREARLTFEEAEKEYKNLANIG